MTEDETPDPWADDKLNRKPDGEHLIAYLLGRYRDRKAATGVGSYILNIDAAWGQGKTFFLDCLRKDLENRGHIVASVNAWKDDHADDPLVTLMAGIEKQIAPRTKPNDAVDSAWSRGKRAMGAVAIEATKQVAIHALKTATGIGIDKLIEVASSGKDKLDESAFNAASDKLWEKGLEKLVNDRIGENIKANEAIEVFRVQTATALAELEKEGASAPFFVFVDELDRCRPTFAIRLLEDLKHLFSIDGLVFVVATDSDQLAHSVKAIYGSEFQSHRYLRRFFDSVFVFPDADRSDFLKWQFEQRGIDLDERFFALGQISPLVHAVQWADGLKLSNRDIVQILDIVQTFVLSFPHPIKIEINFVLALSWAFYESRELFEQVAKGNMVGDGFKRWHIRGQRYDANRGQYVAVESAHAVLTQAFNLMANKLEDIATPVAVDNWFVSFWNDEMQRLYPQGYQPGRTPQSRMVEYASRVRNAGRVLD